MRRILFYLRYAAQNLRNSGRWTMFAVLCVAAGVATVVALRSLGLAIGDSLLANLRDVNHGDVSASTVGGGPFAFTFNQGETEASIFRDSELEKARQLAEQYNARISTYSVYYNIQITAPNYNSGGRPQIISTFFIDPQTYSPTREIQAIDPAGVPLQDLLTGGQEMIVSQNLAEAQNLQVGDSVRVSGTEMPFIVRGIIPTDVEANVNNIVAAFFGFVYIDHRQAATLQLSPAPNYISFALPDGSSIETIDRLAADLWQRIIGLYRVQTTSGLLQRNAELADMLSRFIVVLGLGALLIGGVGIVNTMLVMVGRRTMEIASLKTFGMKGYQVALLFVTEAFFLGLLGSILGVVIGVLLSMVVNQYGEAFLQQRLTWRFHPDAVIYGLGLGMVVTMVFGVLPVLIAARVRPAIILRPNEIHIPRASLLQALGALLIVILVLGFIAGQIVWPLFVRALGEARVPNATLIGIVGITLTLVILGILVGILWVIVWFVSHLPSFGSVDLRLALRNMTARRTRTATTLLALSAGMFALSSITFFGLGARQIMQFQFAETLGGNVMMIPLLPDQLGRRVMDILFSLRGDITYNTRMNAFLARLEAVDGQRVEIEGERFSGINIPSLIRQGDNPNVRSGILVAGRDLVPEDRGKRVIVMAQQSLVESAVRDFTLDQLGVQVGSIVTMRFGRERMDFEVVGIVSSPNAIIPNFGGAFFPPEILRSDIGFEFNILQVPPERLDDVLLSLSSTPFSMAIDVTFLDTLMTRLINQLSAIPTLVGLLSLLAAAVIMANTVSLATLERRRQIGVLKAMGLQRGRVLRVLLLENTLIGVLGAMLGIAISALGVSIMTSVGMGIPVLIPEEAAPVTIGLIVTAVLIAWMATFLSARVAVNERVLKVLRYE
jgi:ABC-type antimicrobial peptide transport system permease subunit